MDAPEEIDVNLYFCTSQMVNLLSGQELQGCSQAPANICVCLLGNWNLFDHGPQTG